MQPRLVIPACLLGLGTLSLPGCVVPVPTDNTPRPAATASSQQARAEALQTRLISFADRFLAELGEATERIKQETQDPEQRRLILSERYFAASTAVSIASDPDPQRALLDMLVFVSLQNDVWDEARAQVTFGDHGRWLLQALDDAEADLYQVAAAYLTKTQLVELRVLINAWNQEHPDQQFVAMVRLDDFEDLAALDALEARRRNNQAPLDLFASVRGATAAIDDTRLLGERVVYLSKRMPLLVGWQAELFLYDAADSPAARGALEDVNTFAASADRVATTAEELPDLLATEREAWLNSLDEQGEQAQALLAELRATADALTQTLDSAGQLTQQFTRDDAQPPARPFDITEYTAAAEALQQAAAEMNQLVDADAWPQRLDQLNDATTARIDQVFWRSLVLILVACVGLLVVLRLARRQ